MKARIGVFLESIEVQTIVSILIYADVFLFTMYHIASFDPDVNDLSVRMKLISALLDFNMIMFIAEITATIYSFGTSFFHHVGYTLDLTIVSMIVCNGIFPLGMPVRNYLRFLRFWRFWRLLNSRSSEQCLVEKKLIQCQEQMQSGAMEVKRLDAGCRKETKLREEVENTLISYKDEIDTLKEALQIAALDITRMSSKNPKLNTPDIADTSIEDEAFYDGGEGPESFTKQ